MKNSWVKKMMREDFETYGGLMAGKSKQLKQNASTLG
jgi:hypothetical protein